MFENPIIFFYIIKRIQCRKGEINNLTSAFLVCTKEVIKEQPTPKNLSATATRVLQCTCIVAASRKDCSAIVNMIRFMYKTGCPAK